MQKFYDLARVFSSTTGTSSLLLGNAVPGFLTFADAGAVDGDGVTYCIRDGANSEIGRGVLSYTGGLWYLSRATVLQSTNADAKINCSGSQEVFITLSTADIADLAALLSGGGGGGGGSLPAGGSTGQVLTKNSGTDGDADWADLPGLAAGAAETKNRNIAYNPPGASQFATLLQSDRGSIGSSALSVTDEAIGMKLHDPDFTGRGAKMVLRDIPSGFRAGHSFEFVARIEWGGPRQNASLSLVLSDTTNFICWVMYQNTSLPRMRFDRVSATSSSWTDVEFGLDADLYQWLKITYDAGGNITFAASCNGYDWDTITTSTLSSMGCSAPTVYGFGLGKYDHGPLDALIPFFWSSEFPAPTTAPLA